MTRQDQPPFRLPEDNLSSLPTGTVKIVVDALGKIIAHGEFAEGATIPMEAELVERFGVSRTVIREAIKVLSGKGMVRTARRYGTRVRPFEEWHLLDPDVVNWHSPDAPMAARIYRESTELRCLVEPGAAALAAENATEAQRATILAAAEAITPEPFGVEGMMGADFAFHATILEASGNAMLAQLQGLTLALLRFSYPAGRVVSPDVEAARAFHISVAEAIASRRPARARKRMMEMLEDNRAVANRMAEVGE